MKEMKEVKEEKKEKEDEEEGEEKKWDIGYKSEKAMSHQRTWGLGLEFGVGLEKIRKNLGM